MRRLAVGERYDDTEYGAVFFNEPLKDEEVMAEGSLRRLEAHSLTVILHQLRKIDVVMRSLGCCNNPQLHTAPSSFK